MQAYDPTEPLFFIHIPKTAGLSIRRVCYDWFGEGLGYHYFDEKQNQPPPHIPLRDPASGHYRPGLCVFGHFNRRRGFGLEDYYPEARQRLTFMRDPFERALSVYFYVNSDPTRWNKSMTQLTEATLTEFLSRSGGDNIGAFLPPDLTLDNHRRLLPEHFIHIGVSEAPERSLTIMADKLGMPPPTDIPRLNATERGGRIPYDLREEFLARRPLETALYRYALELNGLPLPDWLPPAPADATIGR